MESNDTPDKVRAKEQLQKIENEATVAFARFKRKAGYASAQLRVIEDCDRLFADVGSKLPKPELPSEDRLAYALQVFDAWVSPYVLLISDIDDQEAFAAMLRSYEIKAWANYRGFVKIEPLAGNVAMADIKNRSWHWFKESLRRLSQPMSASPTSVVSPSSRVGYHVEIREWMRGNGITSVEKAADRLGVGYDILKSIMSDKGKRRYGPDRLDEVLRKIGYKSGE